MPFSPPEDKDALLRWIREKHEERASFHRGRDDQWREDRRILNQTYKTDQSDFKKIMSPEPRNNFRIALDIATSKNPRLQAVIDYQDAEEEARINKAERFAKAIYSEISKRYRRSGNRSWLRDFMSFVYMGGYYVSPLADDTGKHPEFTAQILDPIEGYPEWDETGLIWISRAYKAVGSHVKSLAKRNVDAENPGWNGAVANTLRDKDDVDMLNVFWLQYTDKGIGAANAILANGLFLKEPQIDKRFGDEIPVQISPSNGQPFQDIGSVMDAGAGIQLSADGHSYSARAWESMIAGARQTYKDFDELLSMERRIVENNARPRFEVTSRDGMPKFTKAQWRNGEVFPTRPGEGIRGIDIPSSPRERQELMGYYSGAIERATFNHVIFGNLDREISGVTLDSLINATKGYIAPYIEAGQYGIENVLLSLINQWQRGKMKSVRLESPDESMADRWFFDDFTREDIPNTLKLRAGFNLALPDTLQQRILAAREAMGTNAPLASRRRVQETLLPDLVEDPMLEQKEMDKEEAHNSEEGVALRIISGFNEVIAEANAIGNSEMAKLAEQLKQGRLAATQQAVAGAQQREAGINAQRSVQGTATTEPPPGVSPPEAGGAPPGAIPGAGNKTINTLLKRARNRGGA